MHMWADKVRSLLNARLQNPHANVFVLVNLNLQSFCVTHCKQGFCVTFRIINGVVSVLGLSQVFEACVHVSGYALV